MNAPEFAELLAKMNADPRKDTTGPWWSARCVHPNHADDSPSLRFRDGDRNLLVRCFACDPGKATKSKWLKELFDAARKGDPLPESTSTSARSGGGEPTGTVECEYHYPQGKANYYRVRYRDPKSFRWQRQVGEARVAGLGKGVAAHDLPLFNQSRIGDGPIWITEGEKDVLAVAATGVNATCSPAGAAGPPRDISVLAGRDIRLILDRDQTGVGSVKKWWSALDGLAASVRIFAPAPEHKGADVSDHLADGGTLDTLVEVALRDGRIVPLDDSADDGGGEGESLTVGATKSVPVGHRLAAEHMAGRWIYAGGLGWHKWDGKRWRPKTTDAAMYAASKWLETWIAGMVTSDVDSSVIRAVLRYREVGNVGAALQAARGTPQVQVDAERLDDSPGTLTVDNGVIDLRTGKLLPHDPKRLVTKLARGQYVPNAEHPDWVKALDALPADACDYLQLVFGAMLTGEYDRGDRVHFHRGGGENGKTTLLGSVHHVMGDYAATVPDSVMGGRTDAHTTDLMVLRGARMALVEELPEGHLLPIARIKRLTDTPTMTARLIGQNNTTWRPTHQMHVSSNYAPIVSEIDHGTWRRLVMVHYRKTYLGEAADHTLKRRLKSGQAQQAVLAWLVQGAMRWYAGGMRVPDLPPSIAEATEGWRRESDPLADWLETSIHPTGNPDDSIPMSELLASFNESLPQASKWWSATKFGGRIKGHRCIISDYLGVNRGPRNRLPMSLFGAAWGASAQGAQGTNGDSYPPSSHRNLWDDPAHPAQTPPTSQNAESAGSSTMGMCAIPTCNRRRESGRAVCTTHAKQGDNA